MPLKNVKQKSVVVEFGSKYVCVTELHTNVIKLQHNHLLSQETVK